jgi:hypothetical protein
MHGKNFAVRFWAFAVRPWRTANLKFPVVWGLAAVTRDDPAKSEALYETKKN